MHVPFNRGVSIRCIAFEYIKVFIYCPTQYVQYSIICEYERLGLYIFQCTSEVDLPPIIYPKLYSVGGGKINNLFKYVL